MRSFAKLIRTYLLRSVADYRWLRSRLISLRRYCYRLDGYHELKVVITDNGLCWQDFVLEVTEDVFIDREAEIISETVARFRESGVRVSLDNFGTGFASLILLKFFY